MTIEYQAYKQPEGGKFLKLKSLLPSEGDEVKLKCVDGVIKDGNFGVKVLVINVLWMNPETGKAEKKELSCDAPDEVNEFKGSQIYRGFVDNNIQPNDVFYIQNGGRMNNKYKTVIYNVMKDATRQAPRQTPETAPLQRAPREETPVEYESPDEDVRIEDLPF